MPISNFLSKLRQRLEEKRKVLMSGKGQGLDLEALYEDPDLLTGGRRAVEISQLQKNTTFSKQEICALYRGMKKECPAGYVDKDSFAAILGEFFPLGDSEKYAAHVFRTFNPDEKGRVGFLELMENLSLIGGAGNNDEKLKWIFSLYDVNGDGRITQQEVEEIVDSVYDLIKTHRQVDTEMSVQQHGDIVFKKFASFSSRMDYITWEDFRESCMKDPDLVNSLNVFGTVILVY